ncbi:MAG: hypothetical protein PHY95_03565, partial [Candidatus ainarchaeum sp.]|nr:hypothetical protein [Candidatus ainarchaeum sp.]
YYARPGGRKSLERISLGNRHRPTHTVEYKIGEEADARVGAARRAPGPGAADMDAKYRGALKARGSAEPRGSEQPAGPVPKKTPRR